MSKMNDMAMTIEELRNAATAINDAANWLAQQFSSDDKQQAENIAARPEKKTKPALTLEDVRAVLADKSRAAQGRGGALICHLKDMQSSPHPLLTAGSTAHHQQGSAKPTRIKVVIMLQKAPMPTLFVSTSSAKHLA